MITPQTQQNSVLSSRIEQIIASQPVVLFMKGTPERPQCGFSSYVVQVLQKLRVDFIGVDILQDQELRQGIKDFSQWPTIPQLYVEGEFIGGADITRDMYTSGELGELFKRHGIPCNNAAENA